jgi:hypothetical protein
MPMAGYHKPRGKYIVTGVIIMDNIKVTDYEAVLATITKYTDACKEGKSEIMKPAFTET